MNIFACDYDPVQAAIWLPDKLVVKMPLESAQILCTAIWLSGGTAPYKPTHVKHPCVLWTGKALGNWQWLVEHGLALCDEFTHRYGKLHGSRIVLEAVRELGPTKGKLQSFVMAMPDQYKHSDPVIAYRHFLVAEKTRYASWKDETRKPPWWTATPR